ncbi:MAG: ABC transporter substrate-binding protein [Candidatus Peregrinibacteria bacterium]|nr:ABC transporter substrate-binding protein [Candidatus Peregrinibacteria bacterium]
MIRDFFRTIRSYSLSEKVVSIFLSLLLVFSIYGGFFSSSNVTSKDTYVEGTVGKIMVLNPLYSDYSDLDRDVTSLLFSGLMKYDSEKGKMVEDLAKVAISSDEMLYTFTLRDNVFFHNGDPVTADDVYYTYHDVIQSPDFSNAVLTANFQGVDITKKNSKTIEFRLTQPNSFFLTNLSVGVLPSKIYKDVAVADLLMSDVNKNPVGSGPYQVDSAYTLNSRGDGKITLKRFQKYYGGLPKVNTIVYRTFSTVDRMLDAKDDLDAMPKLGSELLAKVQGSKFTPVNYTLPQYKAAFFNMDSLITGVKPVRLAMLKSVDKDELMSTVAGKTPVDTPFMELNQEDWVYKSDIEEAKGALYDAGYRYADGEKTGFRKTKKGNPMVVRLAYFEKGEKTKGDSEDATIAEFLKNSWEAIGIQVELYPVTADIRTDFLQKRDYDVLLAGESMGYDLDTYSFWHSSQATGDGSNLSNYKNFSADALIEDIRHHLDDDRKATRLKQLAKLVKDDIPALFLFRPQYIYATDAKFQGVNLSKAAFSSDRFYNIQGWSSK